ncbi:MAG: glycosyltransferase, partial [Cyanobacteria bacterium J06628_3]
NSLNRGGIEKWLLSMLDEVPRNEYEMDVCCKGSDTGTLADVALKLGAKVMHCPLAVNQLKFVRELTRILKEGQYDILHNHTEAYSGLPVWVAHQLEIPVITSFHNTSFLPQTGVTRLPFVRQLRSIYAFASIKYALRYSDFVTGCSQGVIDSLDPDGKKLQKYSRVLYYGIDIPELSTLQERAAFRQSFGWSEDVPIIIHVGRFIEQKNHLGLLSVFEQVLKQIKSAKLLLVGEGSLQELIKNTINKRELADSVVLLGLRDDVPSLMSKCDVFLFPSLYEGFGIVAIEANAANLPVVGSKVPGVTEAVVDCKTALLHDVEDIDSMANSTIKLINDQDYYQQLSNAGRIWVKDNYSTAVSAKNLVEIYDDFL